MDNGAVQEEIPAFFEDTGELPLIDEQISTGFPSFHAPPKRAHPNFPDVTEEIPPIVEDEPITGTIPSFYSAFDTPDDTAG